MWIYCTAGRTVLVWLCNFSSYFPSFPVQFQRRCLEITVVPWGYDTSPSRNMLCLLVFDFYWLLAMAQFVFLVWIRRYVAMAVVFLTLSLCCLSESGWYRVPWNNLWLWLWHCHFGSSVQLVRDFFAFGFNRPNVGTPIDSLKDMYTLFLNGDCHWQNVIARVGLTSGGSETSWGRALVQAYLYQIYWCRCHD